MTQRILMLVAAVGIGVAGAQGAATRGSLDALETGFQTPPDSTKPWCYWYWISDNISKEGITRDLEAMRRAGIGEALIGNIFLDNTKIGGVKALSEPWWGMIEHAIREGGRIGVDIGLFNCPGWSQSGGPWIDATQTMRHIAISETRVKGGAPVAVTLPVPKQPFQDLAVLAFPAPLLDTDTIGAREVTIRCEPAIPDAVRLIDGRPDTAVDFPAGAAAQTPLVVDLEAKDPFIARSLVLHPAPKGFIVQCELQAKDAAGAFKPVRQVTVDRHNIKSHVGFQPSGPVAVAFPAVTSRTFRLVFTGLRHAGGLGEIELAGAPRIEHYVEKQLAKMFQDPLPPADYYLWPRPACADSADGAVAPEGVLNLSDRMGSDGTLRWDAPHGDWVVLRTGLSPTGARNAPASPEGVGYEVDKMNRAWTEHHFRAYIGRVLDRMPAADRKAFKHVVADSYEMGSQNWTEGLAADFRARYGYDPLPWLPALTGRVVGSPDRSDRFLWDLRRLVADRISRDYVGGLRDACERNGLRLWLENYGHWGFPGEFLQYGGASHDLGGEFWATGDLGAIELRAAASAAHIYGKPRVSAEAFTSALRFESTPWSLKRRGDWALTEGINHWVLHVYIHQPWEDRIPGVNAWFSTEFNRHNTWYDAGRGWIDYYRRCCFLLQQGRHVADVAYFIGEDTPRMTGQRDPPLPAGHDFDFVNADVILDRMKVRDGRFVLPSGASYRVLVLPDRDTMRPAVMKKIRDLVADGGAIVGRPPSRSPSMEGFPACDAEVAKLAAEVWGAEQTEGRKDGTTEDRRDASPAPRPPPPVRSFGRGRVFAPAGLREVLDAVETPADVADAGGLLWTHRSAPGAEIYFVCNTGPGPVRAAPRFRVGARAPELWDPVSGRIVRPACFEASDAGTRVALDVEPGGSLFVVFREPARGVPAVAGVLRDGELLATVAPKAVPAGDAGAAPAAGTFTIAGWLRPEADIDLPKEADAGVCLGAKRNEAVAPLHGDSVFPGGGHAGAGISAGRNGVVVLEHSGNYYAPILVHAAPLTNWTHVAVVYRDGRPELFLDGRRVHAGLKSRYTVHSSLAGGRDGGGGAFRGEKAGIESVERALSAGEIVALARSKPRSAGPAPMAIVRTDAGGLEARIAEAGLYSVKRADGRTVSVDARDLPAPEEIAGPWEVRFPAKMDVPERITLDRLIALDQHPDEAVKHFSGTATYRKVFDLPAEIGSRKSEVGGGHSPRADLRPLTSDLSSSVFLDLGRVESMAEVVVNGRTFGVLWKPPFVVDVTDAVQPGTNTLEVRVTGTWRNRLVGDAKHPDGFPGGAKPPQFKPFVTADPKLGANAPLAPYGLLGPVRLQPARRVAVE
jgi:hypothetical protein